MSDLTFRRGYLWFSLLVLVIGLLLVLLWPVSPGHDSVEVVDTLLPDVVSSDSAWQAYTTARHYPYDRGGSRRQKTALSLQRSPWISTQEQVSSSRPLMPRADSGGDIVLDLNGADSISLQMLRGIGPVFASRIVRYRERLGGFVRMEQLKEVYGFSEELYENIAPHLTLAADSIRPLHVNTATVKELMRHPYIDAWLARDMVRFRTSGHRYTCDDDLRLVGTMDDSTLARLMPYISFD